MLILNVLLSFWLNRKLNYLRHPRCYLNQVYKSDNFDICLPESDHKCGMSKIKLLGYLLSLKISQGIISGKTILWLFREGLNVIIQFDMLHCKVSWEKLSNLKSCSEIAGFMGSPWRFVNALTLHGVFNLRDTNEKLFWNSAAHLC